MSKVFDIAKALATALKANGFPEAEARMLPYMKLEEATGRKCVVMPRNATYQDGDRAGFDTTYEIAIALQKAIRPTADDTTDDAAVDVLLGNVQSLVALWDEEGPLREAIMAGASYQDGPEHPTGHLCEPSLLTEEHQFFSWTIVRYEIPQ